MARKRNQNVNRITFDIMDLAVRFLGMNDDEIGAWMRKAVSDWNNGCTADDVDPLVKECYEKSHNAVQKRQNINAKNYLAHHRKRNSDGDVTNREAVMDSKSPTSPSTNTTGGRNAANVAPDNAAKSGKDYGVTSHREAGDVSTTDSLTIKADGDTRECSHDKKSGTSATHYDQEASGVSTPQLISANGPRQAEDAVTEVTTPSAGGYCAIIPANLPDQKKPYGTCQHVMLTDSEGRHLRELYGENLRIAIDILDAYIENNGKAAKKYKNHAAVLRKGNWVWEKVQKMVLDEKRIANADRSGKSFRQMERDREVDLMHHSLFAPTITDTKRVANG
jgi:hypothetical protein